MNEYIKNKCSESPSWYIKRKEVEENSQLSRLGYFPYPFYFRSNPLDSTPTIDSREAGWYKRIFPPPVLYSSLSFPRHKFQSACNTVYTEDENGIQQCINLYR